MSWSPSMSSQASQRSENAPIRAGHKPGLVPVPGALSLVTTPMAQVPFGGTICR